MPTRISRIPPPTISRLIKTYLPSRPLPSPPPPGNAAIGWLYSRGDSTIERKDCVVCTDTLVVASDFAVVGFYSFADLDRITLTISVSGICNAEYEDNIYSSNTMQYLNAEAEQVVAYASEPLEEFPLFEYCVFSLFTAKEIQSVVKKPCDLWIYVDGQEKKLTGEFYPNSLIAQATAFNKAGSASYSTLELKYS